ncbi:MAG: glycosyltransferase family protein [Gemmatimonadota bacterium]
MSGLRVGFVVQGEGRGHMTQALALAGFLRDAGHAVSRVWVGTSPYRSVPQYFTEGMGAPVEGFASPVQVPDRRGVAVSPTATVADALRRAPAFARAARRLHEGTRTLDVVVNFLDLLAGMSRVIHSSTVPAVAVAHNYLFLHPDLQPVPGATWVRRSVLGWMRATAARTELRLALSFSPGAPAPGERLEVVPPLLRPGLDRVDRRDDGFLLAYALNSGYGDLLAAWQRAHPEVPVRCYLDGGPGALRAEPGPGFAALPLHQERFLTDLGHCRAFVGSAGFESICEAFHLGKPVLAVPTSGHYEQKLNAWDAERHGAARAGDYENLSDFWRRLVAPSDERVQAFRSWVAEAPSRHVDAIERASRAGR